MTKVVTTILLLLFGNAALSSTCFGEKQPSLLTQKYKNSLKFEILNSGQEVDVKITAPSNIEGVGFTSATLVKGNVEKMDFDFMFSPSAKKSGDHVTIYYMVKKDLFSENTLQLKYGAGCGKILEYPVAI